MPKDIYLPRRGTDLCRNCEGLRKRKAQHLPNPGFAIRTDLSPKARNKKTLETARAERVTASRLSRRS